MNIAEEDLTFDGDRVPTYTVQVTNFHHKMKNWSPTRRISTKTFKVQDVDLYLKIYPNGAVNGAKGHVSVCLFNNSSKRVYVHYMIQIGNQERWRMMKCFVDQGFGRGWKFGCNHVTAFTAHKPDEDLKIVCKILKLTTSKVVWDLLNEANSKLKASEAKQNDLKAKLASMETKVDKMKEPTCPICFEEMSYDTKIAQCISGHFLCWSCKEKLERKKCPSCGQPVNGRAFGMENYLRSIFGV